MKKRLLLFAIRNYLEYGRARALLKIAPMIDKEKGAKLCELIDKVSVHMDYVDSFGKPIEDVPQEVHDEIGEFFVLLSEKYPKLLTGMSLGVSLVSDKNKKQNFDRNKKK